MNSFAQRKQQQQSRAVANGFSRTENGGQTDSQFVDDRPEATAYRKLDETLNRSPRVQSQLQLKQNLSQSPRGLIQARWAEDLSNRKAVMQTKLMVEQSNHQEEPGSGQTTRQASAINATLAQTALPQVMPVPLQRSTLRSSGVNQTAKRISGQKVIQRNGGKGSNEPSPFSQFSDYLRMAVGLSLSTLGGGNLVRATVGNLRGAPPMVRLLTALGGGVAATFGERLMDPGEPRSYGFTQSGHPYTTASKEDRRRPSDALDVLGTGAYGVGGALGLALPVVGQQQPLFRRIMMKTLVGKGMIASAVAGSLLSGRRPMFPPESEGGGTRFGTLGPGDPGTKLTKHSGADDIFSQGRDILEMLAGTASLGYGGYALSQAAKPASWLKTLPRFRMLGAGLAAAGAGASILRPHFGSFGLTEQGEPWKTRERESRESPTALEAMGYPLYGAGAYYMHQAAFNKMKFLDRRYMALLALMAMHSGRRFITSSQQGASGITPEGRLFFRSGTLPRIKEKEDTTLE